MQTICGDGKVRKKSLNLDQRKVFEIIVAEIFIHFKLNSRPLQRIYSVLDFFRAQLLTNSFICYEFCCYEPGQGLTHAVSTSALFQVQPKR